MGPDGPGKHCKGKNRISIALAQFLNNSYQLLDSGKTINPTCDLLCTSCFNYESKRIASTTTSEKTDFVVTTRSSVRAAASLAYERISTHNQLDSADYGESSFHASTDDLDDDMKMLEERERRAQTLSVLNEISALLSQERITDIRNQNLFRTQVNKMVLAIREYAESLAPHADSRTAQTTAESEWTVNEAEELIEGFRQLVQCSEYTEQIRLLTLAPRGWGRAKIESFFYCSERQARYGVHLRDSGRVLHRPMDLRGNFPFDPQIEIKIVEFYHDDSISRVSEKLLSAIQRPLSI